MADSWNGWAKAQLKDWASKYILLQVFQGALRSLIEDLPAYEVYFLAGEEGSGKWHAGLQSNL